MKKWIFGLVVAGGLMAVSSAGAMDCAAFAKGLEAAGDVQKEYEGAMRMLRLYDEKPSQDCMKQALPLLEKAAKAEHPGALFQLGRIYTEGQAGEMDWAKGLGYFRDAARLNDSHAMTLLGAWYELGLAKEKDPSKALKIYRMAAERGDEVAAARVQAAEARAEALLKKNHAQGKLTPEGVEMLKASGLIAMTKDQQEPQVYRDIANAVNERLGVAKGRRMYSADEIFQNAEYSNMKGLIKTKH